jgi:hypothetical protein
MIGERRANITGRKPLVSAVKLAEFNKKLDICSYVPLKLTQKDIRKANKTPVISLEKMNEIDGDDTESDSKSESSSKSRESKI